MFRRARKLASPDNTLRDISTMKGKSSGQMTGLQFFFMLLLCTNIVVMLPKAAIWQLLLAEKSTFRLLRFPAGPPSVMEFDPSVEVWAQGNSSASEDAQLIRRCCLCNCLVLWSFLPHSEAFPAFLSVDLSKSMLDIILI